MNLGDDKEATERQIKEVWVREHEEWRWVGIHQGKLTEKNKSKKESKDQKGEGGGEWNYREKILKSSFRVQRLKALFTWQE